MVSIEETKDYYQIGSVRFYKIYFLAVVGGIFAVLSVWFGNAELGLSIFILAFIIVAIANMYLQKDLLSKYFGGSVASAELGKNQGEVDLVAKVTSKKHYYLHFIILFIIGLIISALTFNLNFSVLSIVLFMYYLAYLGLVKKEVLVKAAHGFRHFEAKGDDAFVYGILFLLAAIVLTFHLVKSVIIYFFPGFPLPI